MKILMNEQINAQMVIGGQTSKVKSKLTLRSLLFFPVLVQ